MQEELEEINRELAELMLCGANDEKLVTRKRELEKNIKSTGTGINVLSLFDGMSCGQIALNRSGIKYDKYYASEIDKYAMQVTQKNYPKTIQLGSITELKTESLPEIELLFGGSPCQSFSNAGNGKGFEGKSGLFWE